MPCTRPIPAYKAPGETISFSSKKGYGDLPIALKCGQCFDCRKARAAEWAIRCMHEAQMHDANSFVTMTYDDEHLPSPPHLQVRDFQLFAKRTRKALGPFRYFHCGEYGDDGGRPHYHAILFGLDFYGDRYAWKQTPAGNILYRSPTLEKLWPAGHSLIGHVAYDSANYVASYTYKGKSSLINNTDKVTGELRQPQYATMSLKPGIGQTFYDRYKSDLFPSGTVVVNGHERKTPKFYETLYEAEDPEGMARVKAKRYAFAAAHSGDATPERLREIEKVHEANQRIFDPK